MSTPPMPFFMDGPSEDQGYLNVRDHPDCAEDRRFVEGLWSRFHQLEDPHSCEDARNHFLQRFWEMYLAVTLREHGFILHRKGSEGPEFYTVIKNRRIWFEAIAPSSGVGPDKVPQLVPDQISKVPTEKILLRFTNAFTEKRNRYDAALKKGIVSPEDFYVLAINSRGMRHAPDFGFVPHFVQPFLAFGRPVVAIDDTKDFFYQFRPAISKVNGSLVSSNIFLDEDASFCSAVLHSSVYYAQKYADQLGSDFAILHNPNARHPLDATVFEWCEQFTFRDDQLYRSKAYHADQHGCAASGAPGGSM